MIVRVGVVRESCVNREASEFLCNDHLGVRTSCLIFSLFSLCCHVLHVSCYCSFVICTKLYCPVM